MKKVSLRNLKKRADKLASEYVRRRDEKDGCITCGKIKPWKEMNAGHYIRRTVLITRFHPLNLHGQCPGCNLWGNGEPDIYRAKLVEKYGEDAVLELEKKRFEPCKFTTSDYDNLIAYYQGKLKELMP